MVEVFVLVLPVGEANAAVTEDDFLVVVVAFFLLRLLPGAVGVDVRRDAEETTEDDAETSDWVGDVVPPTAAAPGALPPYTGRFFPPEVGVG